MNTTTTWLVGAVTLAVATAALAIAIVALVAGDEQPQQQHVHELPHHSHELPAHEHDQGLAWEWLGLLAGADGDWSSASDPVWAERTDTSASNPSASAVDLAYLRDVCLAGSAFWEAMLEREPEVADADPAAVADAFLEPMRQLAADLRGATPPADLEEHHAAMLANIEEGMALFEGIRATLAAGENLDDDAIDERYAALNSRTYEPPPQAARLAPLAGTLEECRGAGDFISGFLGSDGR